MKLIRTAFFVLLIFTAFTACKEENERPQWEVNLLGPLVYASLGVENFIADSLMEDDSTHAVSLVYEGNLYTSNIDSLFQIRDTTLPTVFIFPFSSFPLGANTLFYGSNNNLTLNISGVELREVIIKSGFLHVEAQNKLQAKVVYTYTIPKATLHGTPFQFRIIMDPAPPGGTINYSGSYDMSGYKIDLTGSSGNLVNTLSYNIIARTDTNSTSTTVFLGDTLINLKVDLQTIVPYYAKGFLGQAEIDEGPTTKSNDLFNIIQSGSVRLKAATMQLIIENNIGVDAQAIVNKMQSFNSRTNSLVDLNAPQLMNRTLNINRASESGDPIYPVNPTNYVVRLDNSNSNLRSFLENMPDRMTYAMKVNVNPYGNISGSNDFVYSDYLLNVKTKVNLPLAFASDHLTVADTTAFSFENNGDYDPVKSGTFTLIVDNGFPFEADVHLILLDANNQFLDSLPVSGKIAAANVDANFLVTSPKRTKIPVFVDAARKERIFHAKNISLRASFTTPDFPQYFQIYSTYRLNLKLVADATYLID